MVSIRKRQEKRIVKNRFRLLEIDLMSLDIDACFDSCIRTWRLYNEAQAEAFVNTFLRKIIPGYDHETSFQINSHYPGDLGHIEDSRAPRETRAMQKREKTNGVSVWANWGTKGCLIRIPLLCDAVSSWRQITSGIRGLDRPSQRALSLIHQKTFTESTQPHLKTAVKLTFIPIVRMSLLAIG